jgi:hypothetical protein
MDASSAALGEDISVPADIESLTWDKNHGAHPMPIPEIVRLHNWQVFEAYRRGQVSIADQPTGSQMP